MYLDCEGLLGLHGWLDGLTPPRGLPPLLLGLKLSPSGLKDLNIYLNVIWANAISNYLRLKFCVVCWESLTLNAY